jgi:hypothetical protein
VSQLGDQLGDQLRIQLEGQLGDQLGDQLRSQLWYQIGRIFVAYYDAGWLVFYRFFDEHYQANDLHALAHFNELVSGYLPCQDLALLVRKPLRLAFDRDRRLHSATGTCVAYRDGWGFYAWHGVQVPERVIRTPEQLTRADFLGAENTEVRRVIQERMGERFVPELGGTLLQESARGRLYEVVLPDDDPERVARYVQVQDASTPRQYFLRVPPSVQTADEAVAWTFATPVEQYLPAKET